MWPCINFGNGRSQSGFDARIHLALFGSTARIAAELTV
jgi:hypothetical protein